jgi:hypothetical protein
VDPQAPIIIFNDADLVAAINGTAFASFIASGQTCVSGARILIQDEIYDKFMVLFLEKIDTIRRGMGNRRYLSVLPTLTIHKLDFVSIEPKIFYGNGHFVPPFPAYRRNGRAHKWYDSQRRRTHVWNFRIRWL